MDGITKALTVEPEDTSPPKAQPVQPDGNIFDRSKVLHLCFKSSSIPGNKTKQKKKRWAC